MSEPVRVGLVQTLSLAGLGESSVAPDVRDAHTLVLRLYDECAPGMRRYVRSLSVPADSVEDIVQEAFLELFRHVCAGRSQENLPGWLFRVARNAAFKRHRQEQRVRRLLSGFGQPWANDDGDSAEERLVLREERRRLRAAVQALRNRDRQCLRLRAEGLSYRDIAEALGISLGSVAKSLARAFGRLARAAAR